jgi:hypothetical protein
MSPLPENVKNVFLAASAICFVVHFAIDFGNFIAPTAALSMLHIHDVIMRPMKIICDEAYLLVQPVNRIT